MTNQEIQDQIVEEFSGFTDWMDKYAYLIELGKELTGFKEEFRLKENLIKGCQSQVWLHAELKDGIITFYADSDAILTKGLIALLLRAFSGFSPSEILTIEPWFVEKIGLNEHLSPTRSNGLVSMIKQIKLYAMAYQAKSK